MHFLGMQIPGGERTVFWGELCMTSTMANTEGRQLAIWR
jgi:hypothetical protein